MPVSDTLTDPTAEPNDWLGDVLIPWVDDVADAIAALEAGGGGTGDAFLGANHVQIRPGVDGVDGDGANDRAAIQALIDAAGDGGTVEWLKPTSFYSVGSALNPIDNQLWYARNWVDNASFWLRGSHAGPVIQHTGTGGSALKQWTLEGLGIKGNASAGGMGIDIAEAHSCEIKKCHLNQFGNRGIYIRAGIGGWYHRNIVTGALLAPGSLTDWAGAVEVHASDAWLDANECTCSQSAISATGFQAGIVYGGTYGFLTRNVGEISDVGIVLTIGHGVTCIGDRADLNFKDGWHVEGNNNTFLGARSFRNSGQTTATYDGFVVSGVENVFTGCLVSVLGADAFDMRHGFNDSSAISAGDDSRRNIYNGNYAQGITGDLYAITGSNSAEYGSPGRRLVRTVTGTTYQATYTDDIILGNPSSGTLTVTTLSAPFCTSSSRLNKSLLIKRIHASNSVVVDGLGSETIDGAATKTLGAQHSWIEIISDGTNWRIISQGGTVT
jgi:hypothetical protein